ncbi:MAG: glutathione S-transferase C-terminal domain-containing protein [Solirubrobacteraceae bacterium]
MSTPRLWSWSLSPFAGKVRVAFAEKALRDRLVRRWATAEQLLGRTDGRWLTGGEQPTLADLAALPLAVRLPAWKPELQPDPAVAPLTAAWLQALRERPSATEVDRRSEPQS